MSEINIQNFIETIPRTIDENIKFRETLNLLCQTNVDFKKVFLHLCKNSGQIFFDCLMWAVNSLETAERRILPFILRPKQIKFIKSLEWCIDNQHDFGCEKTRYEGATDLIAKTFVKKCLFEKNVNFIVGSLREDDVDRRPNPSTIFAKIDNAITMLPKWFDVEYERAHRIVHFKQTNSTINGETTNENFSAGGRATAVLLDEFGRVPKAIAEMIEGAVRDVSKCIIYNGTHWLGAQHPFNISINAPTTHKETLFWFENEEKSAGLYVVPEPNVIELLDEKYYWNKYPELFNYAEKN